MIEAVALWFATSKLGRAIAAGAAIALAVGIAVLEVFSAGKRAERTRQDRESLNNLRERQETDGEVDTLGHADVDDRMRDWMRKP